MVAAFWFLGGSGWPVLIPALVWAALPDRHVWPGDLATGWLVVEPGWPGRFGIERCPPDLDAEESGVEVEAG